MGEAGSHTVYICCLFSAIWRSAEDFCVELHISQSQFQGFSYMVQLGSQRVKKPLQTQTSHRMNSVNIIAFIVLQNLADLEKVRGLCSEMCPVSSCDAYQAITIKAEVSSDAEEECPARITVPEIKAEPEVSCFYQMGFTNTGILCFTNFVTANNLVW
jgi:hypothetical protein